MWKSNLVTGQKRLMVRVSGQSQSGVFMKESSCILLLKQSANLCQQHLTSPLSAAYSLVYCTPRHARSLKATQSHLFTHPHVRRISSFCSFHIMSVHSDHVCQVPKRNREIVNATLFIIYNSFVWDISLKLEFYWKSSCICYALMHFRIHSEI